MRKVIVAFSELKESYALPYVCSFCHGRSWKAATIFVGNLQGVYICEDCYRRIGGDEEETTDKG